MNCISTYQWKSQAAQFAEEFVAKFGGETTIKNENGCHSIYTSLAITKEMISFTHHEFVLSPENRSVPDAPYWKTVSPLSYSEGVSHERYLG